MRDVRRSSSVSGRQSVVVGLVTASCTALWATSLLLPSWAPSPRVATAHGAAPPSVAELNGSLALADRYLSGLYKSLDPTSAVMSEYYGLPLRVYLTRYKTWLLAGRDGVAIVSADDRFDRESFSIDFRTPWAKHSPELEVIIDWDASPTHYTVDVVNRRFADVRTSADVYLGDVFIGRVGRPNLGASLRRTFRKVSPMNLRSFRYTIRHGTQQGRNYFAYRSDWKKSARLGNFIRRSGFALNYDLTAPIWSKGTSYADAMPYDASPDGLDAYHDCGASLASSSRSYPYRSKVCVASPLYVWLSHSDTLAPAAQAIHVLNRYADPERAIRNRRFPVGLPVGWDPAASMPSEKTARSVASETEAKFRELGYGVPPCLSTVHCSSQYVSGIRTFQFGALETLLGYRFGDSVSRSYADAVARLALAVQVRDNGLVRSDRGTYYRPATVGSFYLGWDRGRKLRLQRSGVSESLVGALYASFDMAPEYRGIIPSNAETTLTAYAFLTLYRCQRYRVGCGKPSGAGERPEATEQITREAGGTP
jgi:hypothetical protein